MKPWLALPPEWAHDLGPYGLKLFSLFKSGPTPVWQPFSWRHLQFKNPLGLAGGVDKNAESLNEWWNLGAGFVEVGTVTPRAQKANPGKIMDRDLPAKALWNKMGFPSAGADEVFYNLRSYDEKRTPVFVNVGKNRDTSNSDAADDYVAVIRKMKPFADAYVVNISSPNTQGLRSLQNKDALYELLTPILAEARKPIAKPVLLKLSPDLTDSQLQDAVFVSLDLGVDGFVLTNTTLSRPNGISFPPEGGLSGAPLKTLSAEVLRKTLEILGSRRGDKLIVSAGGLLTPEDVFERLQMGADLVEIYTALIFEGPDFFHQVAGRYHGRE